MGGCICVCMCVCVSYIIFNIEIDFKLDDS